ncbi:protoporphyrinogen oxidase [Peribacillus kribbensis]|uniref:protoporphyrinogen oxidase n=1 Tax=Peribacillus kribbensis TaxID=356658 RepID=UPI0004161A07|nr:protoporphyrinogen oxidase [Peribacillus kribbensis]
MKQQRQRAVVIGGGITGLTAAYYLQKKAREEKHPLDVILIEAGQRLGGKIQTTKRDGFVIEKGPESFLAHKLSAVRLAKEAGMEDKLVQSMPGRSFVLVRERLYPLPGGSVLGEEARIMPFISTGLFSPVGKLRAAADFVLPPSRKAEDQSLGQFFRRRFGGEVVENLIEPLLSGIYAGDIDHLSLMSTFPEFFQAEQTYKSMILGMKHLAPANVPQTQNKEGAFLTFTTGLESFVEAIESKLDPVSIIKGVKAERAVLEGGRYTISLNNGEVLSADSIIAAVPHPAVRHIFSEYPFFDELKEMPTTSVATVSMAFDASALKKDFGGTDFVVSRNSDYTVTTFTWTHKKWPHSAPEGKVLLRCYIGRAGDQVVVDLSDDEIRQVVLEDLNKIMSITDAPLFTIVTRWKDAMPQYTVGHRERIARLMEQVRKDLPGVVLAGSSYEGISLPDCIQQGEEAAETVFMQLKEKEVIPE